MRAKPETVVTPAVLLALTVGAQAQEPVARAPQHASDDASRLDGVAPRSSMLDRPPRRALPRGRLAAPGATPSLATDFRIRFAGGVRIADVVSAVLAGSPDIEQARLAVESEAGDLLLAASPFDLQVRTMLQRARESLPPASVRDGLAVTVETRTSVIKSFRSGLVVTSELSLARNRNNAFGLPAGRVDASASVRVPLLGGRGGSAAAGRERAAQESVTASGLERDHVVARVVHDAVLAYWRYLAAYEQVRTYVESADRAQRLVEETEVLIRADERPASDLDLMASNRAQKLTAVTVARRTLLDAKYALGIAMGLPAAAVSTLGPPLTGFPETAIDRSSANGTAARAAAVGTALAARRDLAALRTRRDGARLAWEGALREMRSRWDIVTRIGYTGVAGSTASVAANSFAPAAGVNGLLRIEHEPAATNRAVRGRALGRAALYRTAVVAADDLVRRIEANVLLAIEARDNAAREALAAHESVRLSERSVRTEQEKFQLGLGTLFDAILAEDSLTNARLRLTDARLRLAAARVRLRFETGTLLDVTGRTVSVDPDRITSSVLEERES